MASAQVVVTDASKATPAVGGIFKGLSFFLLQRLPTRSALVADVESNGGRVVREEAQADYIIADHVRKDCPAGSTSYTFIENALTRGVLPDPKDHQAGPPQGAVRKPGSALPSKGTRTPFTPEEDRVLWQWVQRLVAEGYHEKGNEIYIKLEAKNPRHTFQSWRDRYIKKLRDNPPAGVELTVAANAPPSPPTAQDAQPEISAGVKTASQKAGASVGKVADELERDGGKLELEEDEAEVEEAAEPDVGAYEEPEFTEDDFNALWEVAHEIEDIDINKEKEAWREWHMLNPRHSAAAWHACYHEHVRPAYLERLRVEKKARKQARLEKGAAESVSPNPASLHEAIDDPNHRNRTVSPARPGSSRSEKRKRGAEEPATEDRNLQKRPKSQRPNLSKADVVPNMQPIGDPKTVPKAPHTLSRQPIELLGSDDEQEESEEGAAVIETQAHDTVHKHIDGRNLVGLVETNGNPLTEANLASQQAQHKAELLRGSDLPQDEEDGDGERQEEFVQYLQNITGSSALPEADPDSGTAQVLFPQSDAINSAMDHPPQIMSLGLNDIELNSLDDMPLASQAEIDAAFDEGINWPPDSPNPSQLLDIQSQSVEFETQVFYPKLPSASMDFSQGGEEAGVVISQTKVASQVDYPLLATTAQGINDAPPIVSHSSATAKEQALHSKSLSLERDSRYIVFDEEGEAAASPDREVQDEIDLSVPEPGDGRDLVDISSESSSSSDSESSDDDDQEAGIHQKTTVETQDIVNAATQLPDLEIPLPSDSGSDDEADGALLPFSQSHRTRWSHEEDKLLLRGMNQGMSASQVSKAYGIQRTPSAIRNRRVGLLKQYPKGKAPSESEESERDEITASHIRRPSSPPDNDLSLFVEAPSSPIPQMSSPSEHRDSSIDPPSSPERPAGNEESQRNLQHTQKLPDEDIDSYIDKMAVVFGYKEGSIINALKCTSMRPDLAELVLLEGKAGKGLPADIAGIWSEDEDRFLESGNARRLKALEEKHGWEELEARMQFLQEWRDEQEEVE